MVSMPTGNGDIGLNVWVEEDDDLQFYIGKTDAWVENSQLVKLGKVRVHLEPNPFAKGLYFRQELQTRESQIEITGGDKQDRVALRVWVDANHPVVHIELESKKPCDVRVTMESWRTEEREGDGPWEYKDPISADRFLEKQGNRVLWYHRNEGSLWHDKLTFQHLGKAIEKRLQKDPIKHLTFGGIMKAEGMIAKGTDTLKSDEPLRHTDIQIHLLTAQVDKAEKWIKQVEKNAKDYDILSVNEHRKAHLDYWRRFWEQSWIRVRPVEGKPPLSRGYALQRYITACAGRGAQPIKFNGSIFVDGEDKGDGETKPDRRAWGPNYWFQNTRLIYWPLLATGDFE